MMKLKKIKHLKQGGKDMKKQYFNPPDRRKRKKITIKTVKAGIMSSVMAAVTAATTVAAPILSYAADLTETDSSAQTQTITNDDGTQTILNTSEGNETADSTEVSSEDEAEETRFLFLKLKNTGGKIVIDKGEDEEHTVRLVKHKSEDGKTDEEKIDVYDKDDVLVSSEDAAKNNYTYAYEVKSDSVANVKAEADEGYVLKKYEVKAGDANKKADLNADDVSDSHEQAIFMDENKTVDVEFEKSSEDDAGVTDETTQTADEDVSDDCADDTTADNNTNEDADVNDDKEKDEDISVDDSVRKGADAETEDVESKADAASVDDDLSVVDPEEDKAESEAETAVDENDTDDVTEAGDEELTTDAEAADDSETTDTGESADETVEEHFLEKADGVDELNADEFASARLIVMTDTESGIVDKEHLIGAYGSIYLLQYKDAAQAMNAYMYYKENAEAVEPDAKITAASETDEVDVTDETKAMTKDDNAVAVLNNEESSSKVSVYSGNSRGKVIALIDTGASESKNVIDRVSLIDDVLNGGTHGDDMVSNIVSQDSDAKILSIRALGNDGYGTYSAVVSAVEYAINSGVGIINLSMYSPKTLATSVLEAEIQKAIDDGITVVGAAGNDGKDAAGYVPGAIDDAYIIGAATTDGIRVAKSNYGQAVDYYVAADTTSEAAAQFTGYVSKNGLDAAKDGEDGLIFTSVANCTTDVDPKDDNISENKDDSTIYDPVIENYIKSHVDKNYVGEGKLTLVNAIDVDATIASADELNEGETIDSLMSSDDFRFLTQQTGRVPVYQLNNDSEYFVAFVDVMHNDKQATALDYEIARNDVTGTSIEGTHYDKDSGLLYIPKKAYYGEDGKYYFQYLQVQILYSITNYDINTTWNSAVISTTERKDGVKESNISGSNIIDMRMAVQVGRNMNVNSMLVNVNGLPIEGKYYSYNPKTGILIIGFSSAVVQSIWVEAEKDKDAPDVEPGMVSAKTDFEGMICVASGTVSVDYDKVRKGYAFESTIDMIYPEADGSNWEGVKSSDVIAYRCQTGSDDTLHNALINYIFSKTDSLGFLQDGCVYQPVPGMFYPFVLRLNTIHCNDIRFSDVIAGTNHAKLDIALECTHTDMDGYKDSVATSAWKKAKLRGRVIEINKTASKPYAVFGVYTSKCAGQHGFGMFKVYIKPRYAKLSIYKRIVKYDLAKASGRYGKMNAKFTIYSDKTCKKAVKSVYATAKDSKGNIIKAEKANVKVTLNPGTYYLKETGRLGGTTQNGNVYGPITLKAGDDKALKMFVKTDTSKNFTSDGYIINRPFYFTGDLFTKVAKGTNNTPLRHSVFKVEYSEWGSGDTNADAGQTGWKTKRTWYLVSGVKGEVKYDSTHLADNVEEFKGKYKSSPLFTFMSGGKKYTGLPLCALRITEVHAPTGYAKMKGSVELKITPQKKMKSNGDYALTSNGAKQVDYTVEKAVVEVYKDPYKNATVQKDSSNVKLRHVYIQNDTTDKSWKLRARVKKVDASGKPLAGAMFGIYESQTDANNPTAQTLARLTTGTNGYTSIYKEDDIEETTKTRTLWCKELKAPDGHVMASPNNPYKLTFTLASYNKLYATNPKTEGELQTFGGTGVVNPDGDWFMSMKVKKVDQYGNPVKGVKFSIYSTKEDAEESDNGSIPLKTLTTGSDGYTPVYTYTALSTQTKKVTLYCKETDAPDDCEMTDDIFEQTWTYDEYNSIADKTKGVEKLFGDENGVVVNKVTKPWEIGTYIKKVDEDGRPLAGAEFTVYSDDGLTDDDVVGKLVTGDDGISNTLYVDVPANADNITLYCKETKAPNGYKLVKTVYSQDWSVEDATADGEVKQMGPVDGVVNGDGWSLRYKIRKIDRNGNGLPDAEFTIYTDKELTNSIATLTTDDEGWTDTNTLMRMSKVKSQTLYCVETQSPEGYYGTDEVYEQTWTHDEYKSYVQGGGDEAGVEKTFNGGGVVNDKAWSIRANVKKVDETGWKLGGAEFGIYTNQSCSEDSKIGSLVTDDIGSNGHAKEPFAYELPESTNEITLYCKETKAPNGYELNKTIYSQKWTYEDYKNLSDAEKEAGGKVEDFGPEGGVPNKKIWEVAFWAKKVDENGVPLAGAVFSICTDKSCKSNSCIETLTTKADGTTSYGEFIVDAETEQITLYCKETKAPSGYVLDDKVYEQTWTKKGYLEDMDSEIKQFGPETGIVNHEGWRVRVNIKKIDERQDPLAGAVFGVYTDKSCTDASKVGELKSGKDGMSNILTYEAAWNKESVTLYCKEISAPEGYDKAEDIFSLDFNKSAYLTLKKTKNDTTGELKPFGPKDGVINLDSKPVTVKIHKTSTAASEILGLSGYSLEGAEFKVTGNGITGILKTDAKGESNTLELPNKTAEYTITETKAPKGHKLDSTPKTLKVTMPDDRGKDFVIDFKDEPIFTTNTFQITKKSEKGNVIKGVLFKVEFLDNNATKKTWYLVSDEKGLVKMDMSYTSKEAAYKSDAFYTHNNKVVVPISGKLKVTEIKAPAQYAVDNTPKYLTTSQNDKLEVEMVNTLKPCKINIRKFDADGKTPLKGVSFELKFVKETEKLTATKNGFTRLLKVGGAITKDTDANGNIVFDNLDQGEYQLTEIRTTAGHTLLKDPISITLPITMSQDEAKKNNADTSKATLDAGYTDNWFFYDCKYEVTNTAVFKLPMTGSDGDWKYGIIGFGTLAVLGTGLILMDTRKKRIMNPRKQKRRRK